MTPPVRRPPFDPDVASVLAMISASDAPAVASFTEDLSGFAVDRRDLTVPGYQGAELALSVYSRPGHTGTGPGIFHIHGGGMVTGDRFVGMSLLLPWVLEHDVVVATIEYRLAPAHPDPYPVEDCYAGLTWVAEHAADLGIDAGRIVIAGGSAGGGLAAGTTLLARDRGGPALFGQLLLCPMLDDRDATVSTRQFDGVGLWDRSDNRGGWTALLGERRGTGDVSIYAAPARATDLSGLPPTFIDVGSAEVFRDEDVAYATRIWADGGTAELHVWPGGTHGWEALTPQARMARQAAQVRDTWIARLLDW